MKKLFLPLIAVLLLSGCARMLTGPMLTGMTSANYGNAPLVLAYADPDVIREQNKVATLVVSDRYGMAVNGLVVKELAGPFNPALRISQGGRGSAYIVDLLPGVHKLTVTYNAMTGPDGSAPTARAEHNVGGGTVSGSYSGSLLSWVRTSETSHTLKGGDIYAIGLKMMTISGDIDIYPLDAADRNIIVETRNRAVFGGDTTE